MLRVLARGVRAKEVLTSSTPTHHFVERAGGVLPRGVLAIRHIFGATVGSTRRGSTCQESACWRFGSYPGKYVQGKYAQGEYSLGEYSHPSFVELSWGVRARGVLVRGHILELPRGVRAREVRARGVLARGVLLPINCGAPVGSTRKESTPFAHTSPTPTPRGSSIIRGTLTSACKSSMCKGSARRRSTSHQILELPWSTRWSTCKGSAA